MIYMVYCTVALVTCFVAALFMAKAVLKRFKGKVTKIGTALTTAGICMVLCCLLALVYLSVYYHADTSAVNEALATPGITVDRLSDDGMKGFAFTKKGNGAALVFYAGAKVDEQAYSPLMAELAAGGVDCYLMDIPFHMAMFAANAPSRFIEKFSDKNYDIWMIGGHSLGGIVAAQYAAKHADLIDKIVLLASYPTAEIPQNIELCSIYGSNDGCLGMEQYESHKVNYPSAWEEHIIDGGNHAQFASYGFQKGDGVAVISPDAQVLETAEIICRFAKR